MMTDTFRRQRLLAAIAMTLALLLAACDGGEEAADDTEPATDEPATEEASSEPAESESESVSAAGAGEVDEFCQAFVAVETAAAAGPDIDFETADEEQIEEAVQGFGEELTVLLEDAAELAPQEVSEAVDQVVQLTKEAIQTDENTASNPEFREAEKMVDSYVADECGFASVDVTGVDYAFDGLSDTLEAGVTTFAFANEGEELHEMVVVRINDDVDASLEELLELPEDEAESMTEFVGAAFAEQGDDDTTFLELEPGRYGVLCFIPTGATSVEMLEGPPEEEAPSEDEGAPSESEEAASASEASTEDAASSEESSEEGSEAAGGSAGSPAGGGGELGPPHFTQGMFAEVTVE